MFSHKKLIVTVSIGAFLAILGIVFYLCFPVIFNYLLKQQIALHNGTIGYKVWQDIPLPIYQRLYFFNITNPEDFMRRRAKPKLQEVGPYTFKSRWVKEAIAWHPNGTVSFKEVRTFVFLRNESVGSQNDKIVTLNAPLLLAANFLKDYDLAIKLAASFAFSLAGERLIVTRSIKQLAFDGYRDIIIILSPILKKDIPFKNGLFAWLYGKNDTDDGNYTVFSGENGLDQLNVIDTWNGKNSLEFWNAKSCNMFNGSNAEIGPPVLPYQTKYTFFQSVFCRSITLDYVEDVDHLGVTSKRFMTTNMTFANGTDNPPNACFDTEMKLASGAQDISRCQYGAPVVLSFPHFYFGDPSYLNAVEGLHPNASLHSFHLDVEPNTGFSVDAAVRFQVNLFVKRIPGISQLSSVPKTMFPVFWAEISFSLTEELADVFKTKVNKPKTLAFAFIFACIALGCAIWICAMLLLCWMKSNSTNRNRCSMLSCVILCLLFLLLFCTTSFLPHLFLLLVLTKTPRLRSLLPQHLLPGSECALYSWMLDKTAHAYVEYNQGVYHHAKVRKVPEKSRNGKRVRKVKKLKYRRHLLRMSVHLYLRRLRRRLLMSVHHLISEIVKKSSNKKIHLV